MRSEGIDSFRHAFRLHFEQKLFSVQRRVPEPLSHGADSRNASPNVQAKRIGNERICRLGLEVPRSEDLTGKVSQVLGDDDCCLCLYGRR